MSTTTKTLWTCRTTYHKGEPAGMVLENGALNIRIEYEEAPLSDKSANAIDSIVRCVNSHERMLSALKMARRKIEMWPEGGNPEYFEEIKAIDAAITAAEA